MILVNWSYRARAQHFSLLISAEKANSRKYVLSIFYLIHLSITKVSVYIGKGSGDSGTMWVEHKRGFIRKGQMAGGESDKARVEEWRGADERMGGLVKPYQHQYYDCHDQRNPTSGGAYYAKQ